MDFFVIFLRVTEKMVEILQNIAKNEISDSQHNNHSQWCASALGMYGRIRRIGVAFFLCPSS